MSQIVFDVEWKRAIAKLETRMESCGKGAFASVVKASVQEPRRGLPKIVAVKIPPEYDEDSAKSMVGTCKEKKT